MSKKVQQIDLTFFYRSKTLFGFRGLPWLPFVENQRTSMNDRAHLEMDKNLRLHLGLPLFDESVQKNQAELALQNEPDTSMQLTQFCAEYEARRFNIRSMFDHFVLYRDGKELTFNIMAPFGTSPQFYSFPSVCAFYNTPQIGNLENLNRLLNQHYSYVDYGDELAFFKLHSSTPGNDSDEWRLYSGYDRLEYGVPAGLTFPLHILKSYPEFVESGDPRIDQWMLDNPGSRLDPNPDPEILKGEAPVQEGYTYIWSPDKIREFYNLWPEIYEAPEFDLYYGPPIQCATRTQEEVQIKLLARAQNAVETLSMTPVELHKELALKIAKYCEAFIYPNAYYRFGLILWNSKTGFELVFPETLVRVRVH